VRKRPVGDGDEYEHMIRVELDQAEMHLPKGMLDELGERAVALTLIDGQAHVGIKLPSGRLEVLTYRDRQLVSRVIAPENPSAN
jgi:hypothetical protein